jgi:putative endonuclease
MSMKTPHLETGRHGEEIAQKYLEKIGHSILARNWRSGKGEIDIISKIEQFIVITEVKTRTSAAYGFPHEDISEFKQSILEDTAEAYVLEKEIELELRFDVISIILKPNLLIEHIEDAF